MRMLLLYECMNKMTLSIAFKLHVSSMKIVSNVMKRLRERSIDVHVRGKDKAMRGVSVSNLGELTTSVCNKKENTQTSEYARWKCCPTPRG